MSAAARAKGPGGRNPFELVLSKLPDARPVAGRRTDADGRPYESLFSLADLEELEQAATRCGDCRLIVIDPIGSFLGGEIDAHRENEVRAVLTPVGALAERCGVAILLVAHRRKSPGPNTDDMALGSRAFTAVSRSWPTDGCPARSSRPERPARESPRPRWTAPGRDWGSSQRKKAGATTRRGTCPCPRRPPPCGMPHLKNLKSLKNLTSRHETILKVLTFS